MVYDRSMQWEIDEPNGSLGLFDLSNLVSMSKEFARPKFKALLGDADLAYQTPLRRLKASLTIFIFTLSVNLSSNS